MTLQTSMPVVKGVVFDLGAVVIDWNPMYLYAKVFDGDEAKARHFLSTVCTMDWNEQQDKGRSLEEGTLERIALFPEWEAEIRAYYARWIEMIGGPVPGTAAVMAEIKQAGLRLFALSNWNAETFARIRHQYDELEMFEEIVLSGEYGMIKPEAAFYEAALACYGMAAGDLVFVDDNPRNVAGAARIGLPALLFTGADKLRADLAALGVPLGQAAQ